MEFILLKPMFGIDLPYRLPVIFFLFLCFSVQCQLENIKTLLIFSREKEIIFPMFVYIHAPTYVCVYIYISKNLYAYLYVY